MGVLLFPLQRERVADVRAPAGPGQTDENVRLGGGRLKGKREKERKGKEARRDDDSIRHTHEQGKRESRTK